MNETKRKLLLWYVRKEIKKFDKENNIGSRRLRVEFMNKRGLTGNAYKEHKHKADRIEQLLKWEYSLIYLGKDEVMGEDLTNVPYGIRHMSGNLLNYTHEQWARWHLKGQAESQKRLLETKKKREKRG